jgi:hypothetical protein
VPALATEEKLESVCLLSPKEKARQKLGKEPFCKSYSNPCRTESHVDEKKSRVPVKNLKHEWARSFFGETINPQI